MTRYRWYILSPVRGRYSLAERDKYEITGWSRTKEAAAKRRGANGFVIYAATRKQAASRAQRWWGLDVEWKKFTVPHSAGEGGHS